MIRKQIYIEARQEALLKGMARARGVSEAEIIREALDRHAGEMRRDAGAGADAAWEEALAFMEGLAAMEPVHGGRAWTREDAHERRTGRYGL